MIVNVEIPDQFADQFPSSPLVCARELLEAYVLHQFSAGKITSGHVGKLLGLTFQETERFLREHDAPPGLGSEEHLRGLLALELMLSR